MGVGNTVCKGQTDILEGQSEMTVYVAWMGKVPRQVQKTRITLGDRTDIMWFSVAFINLKEKDNIL